MLSVIIILNSKSKEKLKNFKNPSYYNYITDMVNNIGNNYEINYLYYILPLHE